MLYEVITIISQMTLEEKVNMLHGNTMFTSAGVERLGIADMKYADGPFGIREELQAHGWMPLGWTNDSATFFPTGSALRITSYNVCYTKLLRDVANGGQGLDVAQDRGHAGYADVFPVEVI